MKLSEWKDARKNWVKARDAAKPKVATGAVKGVSLGDAIEGVYKASLKDYRVLETAIQALQKDLTKYKDGIKAKNKDLVTWLDQNIGAHATALLADIQNDTHVIEGLRKELTRTSSGDANLPRDMADTAMAATAQKKPWAEVDRSKYAQLVRAAVFWKSIGAALKVAGDNIKIELPSENLAEVFKTRANDIAGIVGILANVLQAKTGDELFAKMRFATNSDRDLNYDCEIAKDAMKKVLP